MKMPETKQGLLLERDGWESIINSPDWVTYRRFLAEHIIYLQKQVNIAVKSQNLTEAYAVLRAMEDSEKMLTFITQRLNELNNEIERNK